MPNRKALFDEKHKNTRTQDLPESFHDSGQFYWMNTKAILNKKCLITDNTGIIIISELESQDIDTELDWKLAELKYRLINK